MGVRTRSTLAALPASILLGLFAVLAPAPASAQEPTAAQAPAIEVPEARMRQFVTAFRAMAEVRDQYHGLLARVHDREGKEKLREEMDHRLEEVMAEHGFELAEYRRLTFAVSMEQAVREAFDRFMAEAAGRTP